ncbi:MAG: ankyrin repeat domain-containing protein [Candidatus Lindowbacteria bacterium]|nr:ankyrin repeat domain-containing protein [Candidatus Lindowbacteria bacterium]
MVETIPTIVLASVGAVAIAILNLRDHLLDGTKAERHLMKAAENDQLDILLSLLDSGVSPDARGRHTGVSPLYFAAEMGHVRIAEALLNRGADADIRGPQGETPLMIAAFEGNADVVRTLLAHGADINAIHEGKETALMGAASKGHTEIVRLLIEQGADVNVVGAVTGMTALSYATDTRHTEIAQLLKAAGAKG